jgi:hyperpolarization activated cyclic nucleotide-gated potassium channel 2
VTGFPSDSWVIQADLLDSHPLQQYIVAFYWQFQTISTVGYGDISVGNSTERLFATISILIGTGFYSYTIGNLTAIIDS